jgi:hypothetical protein
MNRTSTIGIRRPLPALGIFAVALLLPAGFIAAPLHDAQAAGSPYCNERGNGCNDREATVKVERERASTPGPTEPDPPADPEPEPEPETPGD